MEDVISVSARKPFAPSRRFQLPSAYFYVYVLRFPSQAGNVAATATTYISQGAIKVINFSVSRQVRLEGFSPLRGIIWDSRKKYKFSLIGAMITDWDKLHMFRILSATLPPESKNGLEHSAQLLKKTCWFQQVLFLNRYNHRSPLTTTDAYSYTI